MIARSTDPSHVVNLTMIVIRITGMRTLDEQNTQSFSLTARAKRNAKLLLRLVRMVKAYFTTGASIRRNYRDRERRGEIYFVDGTGGKS